MNNTAKIALAFVAGGALFLLNQKRRKRNQNKKTFAAPDGNTYKENQIYKTVDGKFYRNGKDFHYETPNPDNRSQVNNFHGENTANHYEARPKNVEYHQRGNRHR